MSDMTLETILKAVQTLTSDEQRQLRAQLDERIGQQREGENKIQAFHQSLLASGLVTANKAKQPGDAGKRRLIEVKGKPLSETIIEERG